MMVSFDKVFKPIIEDKIRYKRKGEIGMVNKKFSDYNFKNVKLLNASIDCDSESLTTDIDEKSLYPTFALDISLPTTVVNVVHREILDYITKKEAVKTMRNSIEKIIFNDPATIIIWGNGDKTIVKCGEGEIYDPEKGMAMAIAKHFLGDKGNYYETFKKWLPKEHETVKESKSNTERFISIRDFCNRYNITKNKAYRMIKAGDIYAIKNEKGHWMIDTTAGMIKYM